MNISTAQTCKIFDLSDRLPTGIQITKQPKRKKDARIPWRAAYLFSYSVVVKYVSR